MALDNTNLIISAPNITPEDAQALFGDTNMTVFGACLSPQINQWSRYKPIHYNGVTGVNFKMRDAGYQNNLHGLIAKSYATWADLTDGIISGQNLAAISDWTYNRAALESVFVPKRIGDLDGYYHNAVPPFAGFYCPPTLGNATAGAQQKAYLLPALKSTVGADNPIAPGSIGIDQIESPSQGILVSQTLDKFYFGVALINKGTKPAVKYVLSEVAMVDLDGNITHDYEVSMSLNNLTAGEYYAIPILTRARVSNMTTDPIQICLVPNCSPLQVTVTSSSVVNEDIEVTITSCNYMSLVGADNGVVKSTIRVKSKASYNKKCTYEAYTVAADGTTRNNIQTDNFNLAAEAEYEFTYSVSMTAEEASKIMVGVTVKSKRFDGVTEQIVSATRAPLVPNIQSSTL